LATIIEAMRGIAQSEVRKARLPQLGVVTSIFPHSSESDKDNYECNVRLKNLNVELRRVQVATQCIGLVGVPRVGDLVLVAFIDGDMNAPVVIGRLYNDEDRPPLNKAEEVVYVPPHSENLDVRRIYLEFPGGMVLRIKDDEVTVNAGKTRVVVQRNGDVIIESKANVNVKADGDAQIEAKGSMTLSASSVKIASDRDLSMESGTDMKIKSGMSAEITSSSQMKVEASAQMRIRGATVHIN